MAGVKVTGTADMSKIRSEAKKTGAAIRGVGRASGRRGGAAMGLLEASRAIEDFSVAGMRGALNNIPGLIMSLGAGAGIAGAASIAAVAMMQLTKAFEAMMKKTRDAQENELAKGISFIGEASIITSKELGKAKREAEELFALGNRRSKSGYKKVQVRGESQDAIMASAKRVEHAKELFELRRQGATQEEVAMVKLRQQNDILKDQHGNASDGLDLQDRKIKDLEFRRDQLVKKANEEADAAAKLNAINDQAKQMIAAVNREYREAGKIAGENQEKILAEVKYRQEALGINDKMIASLKQKAGADAAVTKERLRLIDEAIEKESDEKSLLESKTNARKQELKDQAKILRIEAEKLKIAKQETEEENRKQLIKSLSVDSSGMLSSLGSIGLGATEAMNSVNLQNSQLDVLKDIRKNTKERRTSRTS